MGMVGGSVLPPRLRAWVQWSMAFTWLLSARRLWHFWQDGMQIGEVPVHDIGSAAYEAGIRAGSAAGAWAMIWMSLAAVIGLPLAQWLRNRADGRRLRLD